jgi:hypothetical protein
MEQPFTRESFRKVNNSLKFTQTSEWIFTYFLQESINSSYGFRQEETSTVDEESDPRPKPSLSVDEFNMGLPSKLTRYDRVVQRM